MTEQQQVPTVGTPAPAENSAFQRIGFDLRRFGTEVATELGVDPSNPGAFGLSSEQIRSYETATHSAKRNRGSR